MNRYWNRCSRQYDQFKGGIEGIWGNDTDGADVVIFDYDKIQDRATYEQPLLYPEGIDYVLVNGQVVVEHGRHTGARPGQVLYGAGRQRQ